LSLGLTPQTAVDELNEHHGTAALSVLAVHNLGHNLRVVADPDSDAKAQMLGLPLHSTDPSQINAAMGVATALADISWYVPVP
jgi:hypothetical protein